MLCKSIKSVVIRRTNYLKAMLELKDLDECYEFFDDLCTISELQSLAQRLEVAQMLKLKKTYDTIQNETGASTATISRVRRCVDYGSGGYNKVLDRSVSQVEVSEKK